jgi:peptide/nickel transport system permease protein
LLGPIQLLNAAPSFVVAICLAKVINEFIQLQLAGGGQIPPPWYPIPTYQKITDSIAPFCFAALSISLGDGLFTDLFNALRAELTSLNESLFISAVRAKGAAVRSHLIKNLIVPTLSVFTARLPLVLSAVVIVEYIFTLDGSGYLLLQAAKNRDVPVVVGVSLFFIFAVIVMNLILDLVKALVDPREVAKGD